jgi:ABC-type uncharacterized transport system permease subunit
MTDVPAGRSTSLARWTWFLVQTLGFVALLAYDFSNAAPWLILAAFSFTVALLAMGTYYTLRQREQRRAT